jgi:hypothetical protein
MVVTAGAVDLARVTPGEIAELKQRHRWLGCTVEQARSTWKPELHAARLAVRACEGNGGEPVLVLVPPRFEPRLPFVVHTHFHGDFTAVGAPGGVHTLRMRELLDDEPQRLWVLPEARANIGARGTDWDNARDLRGLVAEALAAVGVQARGDTRCVVSAHSAGGRALATVLGNGTQHAHQLVLLDCLSGPAAFSDILAAVEQGALTHVHDVVIVASGAYPPERDARLLELGAPKVRLEPLVPREGLSAHAATARNHLVPRTAPRAPGEAGRQTSDFTR